MRARAGVLAVLLLVVLATRVEAQQTPEGVWKRVEIWGEGPGGNWRIGEEVTQAFISIFFDGYYSVAGVGGAEPRALLPEGATRATLTAEQAAAVWIPYTSNSGAYEVRGSTIVTRPMVALWPNSMAEGTEFVYEVSWDGADMLLTERSADGWYAVRLRRLR